MQVPPLSKSIVGLDTKKPHNQFCVAGTDNLQRIGGLYDRYQGVDHFNCTDMRPVPQLICSTHSDLNHNGLIAEFRCLHTFRIFFIT